VWTNSPVLMFLRRAEARRDGKEGGQLDIGLAPGVSDPLAGNFRAVGVYLHAMNHRARAPAGSEFAKPIDRGNQECSVASGRLPTRDRQAREWPISK
jgi:hypothetical protein